MHMALSSIPSKEEEQRSSTSLGKNTRPYLKNALAQKGLQMAELGRHKVLSSNTQYCQRKEKDAPITL
jgi:hypothetical protein